MNFVHVGESSPKRVRVSHFALPMLETNKTSKFSPPLVSVQSFSSMLKPSKMWSVIKNNIYKKVDLLHRYGPCTLSARAILNIC